MYDGFSLCNIRLEVRDIAETFLVTLDSVLALLELFLNLLGDLRLGDDDIVNLIIPHAISSIYVHINSNLSNLQ